MFALAEAVKNPDLWAEPRRKRNPKWRKPGVSQFCESKWYRYPTEFGWYADKVASLRHAGIFMSVNLGEREDVNMIHGYNYVYHFFRFHISTDCCDRMGEYLNRHGLDGSHRSSWVIVENYKTHSRRQVDTIQVDIQATSFIPEGGPELC